MWRRDLVGWSKSPSVTQPCHDTRYCHQPAVSAKSPGKKGTRLDIQLRCFLDLFPGRKPPSLIPLLHSNKQSITARDAELFILWVLILHGNDGFPPQDYVPCHAPRINTLFTHHSGSFPFLYCFLFPNIPLYSPWSLECQQIRHNVHFTIAEEAVSLTSQRPVCMWELLSETLSTQGWECLHGTESCGMT